MFPVVGFQIGTRFIDPIQAYRRICQSLAQDPNEVVKFSKSLDPQTAAIYTERLVKAARLAFNMPFDEATGEGYTEDAVLATWDRYSAFLNEKKKRVETLPI